MNIVVLDGYTLNPGDLSWSRLETLGSCTLYDRTPPALTVERARDAEALLVNKVKLEQAELEQLPALRYIGVLATALNAGQLAGAGLDVLSTEPPAADNPLLQARHCWITPHLAWATQAARERLMTIACDNLRAFLSGTPQNDVT